MNQNDHTVVRFTNIADFDFTAEMGAMYGGVPYFVPAGKSLLVPKTIGLHLAKHLARQVFIQKAPIRDDKEIDGKGTDRPLWDTDKLIAVAAQMISEEYSEEKPAVRTEAEMLSEKVKELNNTFKEEGTPSESPKDYVDKAEVIAELERRDIPHDKRKTKNALEQLLK